jgi:hypothetical protein
VLGGRREIAARVEKSRLEHRNTPRKAVLNVLGAQTPLAGGTKFGLDTRSRLLPAPKLGPKSARRHQSVGYSVDYKAFEQIRGPDRNIDAPRGFAHLLSASKNIQVANPSRMRACGHLSNADYI